MKKISVIFLLLLISLTSVLTWKRPQIAENVSAEEIHSDFYDVLLVLLDPYARNVINKEYPSRSYALWDAEILEIKRLTGGYSQYDFTVKVKYDTYTGPFNPPEGPITLTFLVTTEGVSVKEVQK
ncbi:hypothetical protein B1B04_07605 [Lysinibacillus sp. KCTC 33748]|uniref:DUF3888 domain-containing protein n=1 Tax=unclassified Lysinibacillus TaxID=2636778 RepID=UPI0009A866EA|nr:MULTISPECIES: DUF3888 domain-containing protein [unclassified Lysinibacillus]OXS74761.1 hypothetical protein B1B04_07605 [Lysinibacillus sp. KCTC 33748]SKB57110.1 Protein of unknown function [Lysinibacillus sp. AC-3]